MTPLNRTLALVEIQDVTVRVADQLNFNMARLFNKFLNEDTVIAKAVSGFVTATGKALQSFFVIESHAQALATAARRRFDHDGVTNAFGNLHCTLWSFNRIINARNTVHTGLARQLFRFNFVAHGGNGVMLGADEGNALFFTALGELSVFAQETVARMDSLGAGLFASSNDFFSQQVALAAWRRTDVDGFICELNMPRIFIGVGIHRHRLDAHFLGRSNDTARNFTAVGNEDFGKHSYFFAVKLKWNIAVFAPRVFQLLVFEHDQTATNSLAGLGRQNHIIDKATCAGHKGIGKAGFVFGFSGG